MSLKKTNLQRIPQVEKFLQRKDIKAYLPFLGRGLVTKLIREEIKNCRDKLKKGVFFGPKDLINNINQRCFKKKQERLQQVINGTGIILHTNLGRAPLSPKVYQKIKEIFTGYSNLEFHLPSKKRGKRGGLAEDLICDLTQAEDALIVNNNAASLFLILNALAKRKKVLVSRGELIQIGGGFRIPDIMKASGAKLVEVGTTNVTTLEDYAQAIDEKVAMILSAHQSNFKVKGFSQSPSLKELSGLKKEGLILVRDLGSGNLVYSKELPKEFEPTIKFELKQGVDLICFSGDKLLGGAQAGFILGEKSLIAKLKKHPLMRILRIDKTIYFILQETLIRYANNQLEDLSLWEIIFQSPEKISKKVDYILSQISSSFKKNEIQKVQLKAAFGGGSLPTLEIDSFGLQFNLPKVKAEDLNHFFLTGEIPIVGSIVDRQYTLNFMTILEKDLSVLIARLKNLKQRYL